MPLILFLGLAVLGWTAYWWLVVHNTPAAKDAATTWQVRGQYGDMFGAFTALVTALGFAGILYTIGLQRRDIQNQTIAIRQQETTSALTAQLNTLLQIQALPAAAKRSTWEAIAEENRGGPGADYPIEKAIALQVQFLDRIAQGKQRHPLPTFTKRDTN